MAKRLSILGSTGSIGVNTLQVVDMLGDEINVCYLSANQNGDLLIKQARTYHPEAVAVVDPEVARSVEKTLSGEGISVLKGREGLLELAARTDVDIMLNGLVGSAGMEPTLLAVNAGIDVALSNKESLVMAGELIARAQAETGADIFPVDSEHSAIWQCLAGEEKEDVRRIILTGSGGPFRTREAETFSEITVAEALRHPNWNMGKKITIDSATMMNKGLEVIEAHWLFRLPPDQIDIVVHPQSIIHSAVEFKDGSVKAQMGVPDMKIPIQYALTYPRHVESNWERLDLVKLGKLTFETPDMNRFPAIGLAYEALRKGGSTPAVLNVANEQAVYRFIKNEILFTDIPKIIQAACDQHEWIKHPKLEDLIQLEEWTKSFVNLYN
ncbi:MAG: 1-deoxy-D-xylulose-5-phosphate reductoisomerase [FCB group bacterium]|nr:1-deoxy-D-xylulose-5-phosphate reductoisomerase [FCB group bacterium]